MNYLVTGGAGFIGCNLAWPKSLHIKVLCGVCVNRGLREG